MSFLACLATKDDLVQIAEFLTAPEIDGSFVRPLSERPESISDRVRRRYDEGFWVISTDKTTNGLAGVRAGIYHPEDEVRDYASLKWEEKVSRSKVELTKTKTKLRDALMIENFDDFCLWMYVLVDDLWKEIADGADK